MRANNISIYYSEKADVLEELDCPPEGRLTATRKLGNLGFFRVYSTIVSPKSQKSKCNLSLTFGQAERIRQTLSYLVKSLKEELR